MFGGVTGQQPSCPAYTERATDDQFSNIRAQRNAPQSEWMSVNTVGCLVSGTFIVFTIGFAVAATAVVNEVAMVALFVVAALFGLAATASISAGCDEDSINLEAYWDKLKGSFKSMALGFCVELGKGAAQGVITGATQRVTDRVSGRSGANVSIFG